MIRLDALWLAEAPRAAELAFRQQAATRLARAEECERQPRQDLADLPGDRPFDKAVAMDMQTRAVIVEARRKG